MCPGAAALLGGYGRLLWASFGDPGAGASLLRRAAEAAPDDPRPLFYLGAMLHDGGPAAAAALAEARALLPSPPSAGPARAQADGDAAVAAEVALLARAVALDPARVSARCNLAAALTRAARLPDALVAPRPAPRAPRPAPRAPRPAPRAPRARGGVLRRRLRV